MKKKLTKRPMMNNGGSTGPSFSDKVTLAAKRVSRNMTNRRAVNLENRSSKLYDTNREKSDKLYDKSEATYDKAVTKNKEIGKFKKDQGFKPGGDGTMMGSKYTRPGKIWSKARKGGSVKSKKK